MFKKAFISGFTKRGMQLEFSSLNLCKMAEQAYNNYKQALDTSNLPGTLDNIQSALPLGLVGDAQYYGLPSALGAMVGNNYSPISNKELKEELDYTDNPSISKALKYLLVPGYTGYRMAKTNRLEHAYDKYRDASNK